MDITHESLEKAVAAFAHALEEAEGVCLRDNELQDVETKLQCHLLKHCGIRVTSDKAVSA